MTSIPSSLLASIGAVLAAVVVFLGASNITVSPTDTVFGAISGPDITSPYLSVNGVQSWYTKKGLVTSTTTPCAIKAPAATSSLESASVLFRTSSTSASVVTIAKAATAYATTTRLGTVTAIAANAQASIVGTTTAANGVVFAPNEWLVVGMQGGVGSFSPVGSCQAVFQVL